MTCFIVGKKKSARDCTAKVEENFKLEERVYLSYCLKWRQKIRLDKPGYYKPFWEAHFHF